MHIVYFTWRWSYSGQMKPFSKSSFSGLFWDPTIVVYLPRWHEALLELQHMLDFLYEMIQIFLSFCHIFPLFSLCFTNVRACHLNFILSRLFPSYGLGHLRFTHNEGDPIECHNGVLLWNVPPTLNKSKSVSATYMWIVWNNGYSC